MYFGIGVCSRICQNITSYCGKCQLRHRIMFHPSVSWVVSTLLPFNYWILNLYFLWHGLAPLSHILFWLYYIRKFHNPRIYALLPVMTKNLIKIFWNFPGFITFSDSPLFPVSHLIHFGGGLSSYLFPVLLITRSVFPIFIKRLFHSLCIGLSYSIW